MRPHISVRGFVRPYVRPYVRYHWGKTTGGLILLPARPCWATSEDEAVGLLGGFFCDHKLRYWLRSDLTLQMALHFSGELLPEIALSCSDSSNSLYLSLRIENFSWPSWENGFQRQLPTLMEKGHMPTIIRNYWTFSDKGSSRKVTVDQGHLGFLLFSAERCRNNDKNHNFSTCLMQVLSTRTDEGSLTIQCGPKKSPLPQKLP